MTKFIKNILSIFKNFLYNLNNFEDVRKFAPNETGVYMFRKDNEVKYVGSAIKKSEDCGNGLKNKLDQHWVQGPADLYNNREDIYVVLRLCETAEDARKLEAELIEKYKTVEKGWN